MMKNDARSEIVNVFKNRNAVQRFLETEAGSNSCLEEKKVLDAAGITLGRQELEELMLVFENQNAVQRFLDLRYDTEYCKKQATILRNMGINPDRDKLSCVMAAIKAPSSIINKAKRYVILNALEGDGAKLCPKAANEVASLRRELAARGLDPQHVVGLEYRALVFANKAAVQNFVDMHDNDKRRAAAINNLEKLGIAPDKQCLKRMLAEFKQNAKEIGRRKNSKKRINMARQQADANLANLDAEMAVEDAEIASAATAIGLSVEELEGIAERCELTPLEFATGIKEFIAAENAKNERQDMADESLAAFVSGAVTA